MGKVIKFPERRGEITEEVLDRWENIAKTLARINQTMREVRDDTRRNKTQSNRRSTTTD